MTRKEVKNIMEKQPERYSVVVMEHQASLARCPDCGSIRIDSYSHPTTKNVYGKDLRRLVITCRACQMHITITRVSGSNVGDGSKQISKGE